MGYSPFYGKAAFKFPREMLTLFQGRQQEEITVHLLGGANMSADGTGQGGVTNHMGEVFTGSDNEVHEGLVCCDASVIPTALGMPLINFLPTSETNTFRCKPTRDNICTCRADT